MIKVIVTDDSFFMRRLVSDILNSDPEIRVVDTAKSGEEAVGKISQHRPDVVTLDLVMPGWDGLATLKHIMAECPVPVVILSAYSKRDADLTIECLHAGAVGFVLKPSGELSLDIEKIKDQLIEEVKAASRVNVGSIKSFVVESSKRVKRKCIVTKQIVVMGSSTGGPQTLEMILPSLPAAFSVPVIVVQHFPSIFFTGSLAEHLNKISALKVKVAKNNEPVKGGKVYLAPAGYRLMLKALVNPCQPSDRAEAIISLCDDLPDVLSPSVDTTMKSAAEVYGEGTIGIILSGMGRDGREGMRAIREACGKTIAQDEGALIFGMPREVIEAGLADEVLPASEISRALEKMLYETEKSR